MGITVTTEYFTDLIVTKSKIVAAAIATGREVYKVRVEADNCSSLVKGDPVKPARSIDG